MGRENRTGVFQASQNPSLAELLRIVIRQVKLSTRTHTVGQVLEYDADTQRAKVSVDILSVVADNSKLPGPGDPNPSVSQPPVVIEGIPVAWPRTSSGYITFPLNEGDKGELHIQDRSLDAWLELGDAVDPVAAWTHALGDAVFHPHIFNDSNPITPGTDQSAAVFEGDEIKIGRGASDAAARVGDTTTADTTMTTWITAVTTYVNGLAPGTLVLPTDFGVIATGSSKVEIE
jgi:hypothetical protein